MERAARPIAVVGVGRQGAFVAHVFRKKSEAVGIIEPAGEHVGSVFSGLSVR